MEIEREREREREIAFLAENILSPWKVTYGEMNFVILHAFIFESIFCDHWFLMIIGF